MKIVSDHGFPKGSMPGDDAFDRFKNERDYIAQSGNLKTTVAAMDWAAAEMSKLREALEDLLSDVDRQIKNPSHHKPFSYQKAKDALGAVRDGIQP